MVFCVINIHTQHTTHLNTQKTNITQKEKVSHSTTVKTKNCVKPKQNRNAKVYTTKTEKKQAKVSQTQEKETTTKPETNTEDTYYSASYFCNMGEIYWNGWRWTWYSEKVLPGKGLNIPGRYTDNNRYVRDCDGYICLASSTLNYGTVIDTPFGGQGKIYDSGCRTDTIDVYVGW